MTNKFAQLADTDEGRADGAGVKSQGSAGPPTRSCSFDWDVLCEPSLNRTAPRGLVNRSNFCYLNAVLQPLLLCQPFVNICGNLADRVDPAKQKWLAAFGRLVHEFRADGDRHVPANPDLIYKCWNHSLGQEDAEEFLRLILSSLHEELLANKLQWTLPTLQATVDRATVEDEWMTVGRNQRVATLRTLTEPESPISCIFNGRFKSIVRGGGQKDSHVYEPFQFLPIDVTEQDLDLIECLAKISRPEQIGSKTKQLLVDKLPPILVVHLKRFAYDSQSGLSSKSFSNISIPLRLDLSGVATSWSDSVFFSDHDRPEYRLFAVVYHMGRTLHGGHYTCHVLHDEAWYYCDDASCTRAPHELVGAAERNKTPYLLFYQRIKL